jgi:hypothetical protein
MIVVADTGPLLHLFWVGALPWGLQELSGRGRLHVSRSLVDLAVEAIQRLGSGP